MRICAFVLILLAASAAHADVIAQWNFNSRPPDTSGSSGSTNASAGSGLLRIVGGASYAFAAGHSIDPASADNTAINLSSFPPSTEANRSAGLQVAANTADYENIIVSWSQRCSATASRFFRLLYSIDGETFIAATNVFAVTYASNQAVYFTNFTADLRGLSGTGHNPNFAVRIVSEFASTATESGPSSYVAAATGSTYGSGGTVRFEMLTISGSAVGTPNTAPTISAITNVLLRANSTYPTIPFTIADTETPTSALMLLKHSSDTTLLPESGIVLSGSAGNRDVTITPAFNQTGSATVSITVVDQGGKSNSSVFGVTVIPTNTLPVISAIPNPGTIVDTPTAAIPFSIGDLDTAAQDLVVSGSSGNPALLPASGILFGGSGSNRTVTLTPAPGQTGHVPVTISVSDGTLATNRSFVLSVDPSVGIIFQDSFSYPDGSLLTNSAFLWQNHSGTMGQLSAVSGTIFVSSENSEDVHARLRGEPYTPASRAVLYYSLTVSAYNLPTALGDYFVHFKDNGSNFRAKLFVAATNAPLGYFRIGIANGASFPTNTGYAEVATDFTIDQTNLVVVRYEVATGLSTLWVNPESENSPSVAASDVIGSTNSVTQIAIRESRFQGDLYVDDVRVATSFEEALGRIPENVQLRVSRSGNLVVIAWPASASGFALQTRATIASGQWQTAPQTPAVVGSENVITIEESTGAAFFRLIKQ